MEKVAHLTIDSVLTPCSIEFCPSRPQLGTCGQYQTEKVKDEQELKNTNTSHQDISDCPKIERLGKCILFQTEFDQKKETTRQKNSPHDAHPAPQIIPSFSYHQLQSIDCAAILDQRWTQDCEQPILITADSEGDLNSYKFDKQLNPSSKPQLELIESFSCISKSKNQSLLSLALDISDKKYRTPRPKTVCSLSSGEIVLLEQDLDRSQLIQTERWTAHDFEPWTCGFDYWQTHTILTGGDDCKLKVWDSRNSLDTPVMVNKQFDGGVTAIRNHHLREHIFAVGSYDSALRIFDKRNFKSEVLRYDAGGGIWRIKWHESDYSQVLLATMHDGFKVISITEDEEGPVEEHSTTPKSRSKKFIDAKVIATLKHRSDLAYGADWGAPFFSLNTDHNNKLNFNPCKTPHHHSLIGSCSFYDRAIHFWSAV